MVMWPLRIDMTRDECRKCLRCLELDAYGSMVSVLRAQGPLTSEKQKLLQELAKVLHISNERHRAEVRRAVNDEKLAVIAEQLNGPNTGIHWAIEGRRAVPLLPRLKARTAFSTLANSLSLATAVANQKLPLIPERKESPKGIINEPSEELRQTEKSVKQEECDRQSNADGIVNHNGEKEGYDLQTNLKTLSQCAISEKRKSLSPLPSPPPSKIIRVSPNLLKTPSYSTTLENTTHVLQSISNISEQQSVAVIPVGLDCVRSISTATCKDFMLQTSTKVQSEGDSSIASSNEYNITKSRPKVVIPQDKLNLEDAPIIVLPNVSLHDERKIPQQCSNLNTRLSMTDETGKFITHISHEAVKICKSESDNSTAINVTRVPVLNANVKTIVSATTFPPSATHIIKPVHPGNTASSGPGPPHIRPITTTVVCTKIPPATLNHQSANRMGITLNSSKTVNIAHHPGTKFTPKTNVIVIQKGSSKGVTLSHAGKEVLGKVIMGGKNLCVSNQQSTSINLLPHRISANNGDQAVAISPNSSSPFANSIKSNLKVLKTGETIVFNLRRDTIEGKETVSQIQKSSSTLTSESKSVIQNTSAHFTRKEDDGSHTHNTELPLNTAATVTTITQESQDR